MTPRRAFPLLLGLVLLGARSQAQTSRSDQTDAQARAGVNLSFNLPNRWTADAEYRLRMIDNLATYRGSYFTLEAGYGLTKRLDAIAGYRLGRGSDWTSHRLSFGLEYKRKLDRWKIGFRPLIQHRTKVLDDDEVGGEGTTFVRTRLRVERRITRRLDAYASVEPYFVFGQDYPIDNWRNTAGIRYEYAKNRAIDLYYIYRPDYGKSYNRTFHVVGVTLRFKTKIKRQKPDEERIAP